MTWTQGWCPTQPRVWQPDSRCLYRLSKSNTGQILLEGEFENRIESRPGGQSHRAHFFMEYLDVLRLNGFYFVLDFYGLMC